MPVSPERQTAQATYPADMQTIGNHVALTLAVGGDTIASPSGTTTEEIATHIKMQALVQNIRYRIDGEVATATTGFQLAAGADSGLVPIPKGQISVFPEAAGAILQYQFLR